MLASDTTMVRDTEAGLRYLVPDENGGERVVKEGYDTGKLFLLGGVFYDDSLDYPLPLAGVNYVDLDFRGDERQLNAFFGGVLGIVNYADPRFLGTKLDLGVDVFGLAIKTSDQLYRAEARAGRRGGARAAGERSASTSASRSAASLKLSSNYRLAWNSTTARIRPPTTSCLPQDNLTQSLGVGVQFARSGYRLNLRGAWHRRSQWEFWGLPGNEEFDPSQKDYLTWEVSASKNWYFSGFRKLGLEIDWADGQDLDRFSKYQFGFFGGNRVHGYQIGKVRAEEALAAHLTYGFELGNLLRLDAVGDAAWATDRSPASTASCSPASASRASSWALGDPDLDRRRHAGRGTRRRRRRLSGLSQAVRLRRGGPVSRRGTERRTGPRRADRDSALRRARSSRLPPARRRRDRPRLSRRRG